MEPRKPNAPGERLSPSGLLINRRELLLLSTAQSVCAAFSGSALASDDETPPTLSELILAGEAAAKACFTLRASGQERMSRSQESGPPLTTSSRVELLLKKPGMVKLTLTSVASPLPEQVLICTGAEVVRIYPSTKRFSKLPLTDASGELPELFRFTEQFFTGLKDSATVGLSVTRNGVSYQSLERSSRVKEVNRAETLYVGPSGLVEGVRVLVTSPSGQFEQSTWFDVFTVNPPLGDGVFVVDLPSDFKQVQPDGAPESPGGRTAEPAAMAPAFTCVTARGEKVTLGKVLAGHKALLMGFWSLDDESRTLPMRLEQVGAKFAGTGLAVLAINHGATPDQLKAFVEAQGLTIPVAADSPDPVNLELTRITRIYEVAILPTVVLIDAAARIVQVSHTVDEARVRELLA